MGLTASITKRRKLRNFVSWFEIPVFDIHRATRFYNAIYLMDMQVNVAGEFATAYFPADSGIGGALVAGPGCSPNATGVLIYLNAGTELEQVLARVEPAGGRVIMPPTLINESAGAFALFIDSEGNRLALHQGPPRRLVAAGDDAPAAAMGGTEGPAPAKKAPVKKAPGKKAPAKKAPAKKAPARKAPSKNTPGVTTSAARTAAARAAKGTPRKR